MMEDEQQRAEGEKSHCHATSSYEIGLTFRCTMLTNLKPNTKNIQLIESRNAKIDGIYMGVMIKENRKEPQSRDVEDADVAIAANGIRCNY